MIRFIQTKGLLVFAVIAAFGLQLYPFEALEKDRSMSQNSTQNPVVVMETTQGTIEIALKPHVAPKACENMMRLAQEGYYNGVTFHRVIKDFMIQGGDPTATGAGGESIWGSPFEDEVDVEVEFDRPGILAMANAGPGTNGSQFFITTAATPWLNMHHTIFGEVISGYDVVDKIQSVPTTHGDRPVEAQKIVKMTVKSLESALN